MKKAKGPANSANVLRKAAEKIAAAIAGRQKVCATPCNQCLFSVNKIVSDKRKVQILAACQKEQTHFVCHKGTIAGENIVCNGFYRHHSSPYLDLMKAVGSIDMVDPTQLEPSTDKKQPTKRRNAQKSGARKNKPKRKI